MQFWNFLAIRLLQAFFVVFVVVSIVFFVSRTVGSPETFLLPFDATNADIEALRENLGLNDPMIIQYGNFLWELLQLDFGNSFRGGGISTIESIGDRSVNTFKLGGAALVVAIGGSVPLGIIAALRRGKPVDWLARLLAVIGQATPSFWLGLMMIFFFAVELGWFPTGGASGFKALILPAISLGLLEMAAIMRLTRSGMIEVMDTDFIRTARAKGLNERVVIVRHAVRHALLPVVTVMGIGVGRLIAGSVIIEVVFAWPGIGRLIIDSIQQNDFPMVQTAIIVLAASISLANVLVDVSYRIIDPGSGREDSDDPARGGGAGSHRRGPRGHSLAALAGPVAPVADRTDPPRDGGSGGRARHARPELHRPALALAAPVFDGGAWDHPLGTDELGRDIYSRLLHGARVSLIVVAIVVPGAALIGTSIGMISGWVGGLTGQVLMRVVDVQLALPSILFAVLMASVFGPSLRNVIIILLVWTWSAYARLVRADVLSLKERDFVTASRATGASGGWIMRKHLLPNVTNTIVIVMTLEIAIVILAEAALSFLGVGVAAGRPPGDG